MSSSSSREPTQRQIHSLCGPSLYYYVQSHNESFLCHDGDKYHTNFFFFLCVMVHTVEHRRLKCQKQETSLYFITGFLIPKAVSTDSDHATCCGPASLFYRVFEFRDFITKDEFLKFQG